MYPRDPIVEPIAIEGLRPTQMTVGMREVDDKRKRFQRQKPKKIGKYLGGHMIPVVCGPKQRYYIIDHHHLALALHKAGMEHVLVTVISDLRQLELDAFWVFLDHHGWVYPYDANGRGAIFPTFRNRSPASRMIRSAASPASCGVPAALPRTQR